MVREKLAEPELLARSPRRAPEDHLMKLIAAIAIADPGLSLRDIAAQLDQMGERPVRGGRKWQPSAARYVERSITAAGKCSERGGNSKNYCGKKDGAPPTCDAQNKTN